MTIVWLLIGSIIALLVNNVIWLLVPVLLSFVASKVNPISFASGISIPHIAVNFFVGNAAGFFSLFAANCLFAWAEEQSKWPMIVIFVFLMFLSLLTYSHKPTAQTPYWRIAIAGETVGLLACASIVLQ